MPPSPSTGRCSTWRSSDGTTGGPPITDIDSAVGLVGSSADGAMMRGSNSYIELWQYHAPTQVGDDPG